MIPFVLCIDVEPDLREPDPRSETRWDGWAHTRTRFGALRERLAALTGRPARFGWYLRIDPQIERLHGDAAFAAKRDRAHLLALRAAGDEIGLHPHFWRRDAADGGWFADFGDRAWVRTVIADAVRGFRESLGFAPESFRAGDALIDDAMLPLLARLGIKYDLTVEPRRRPAEWTAALPRAIGHFPDTEAVPTAPYRPARRDYRRPGRIWPRRIWMVPISMTRMPGGRSFEALNLVLPWEAAAIDTLLAARAAPFVVAVMRAGDLAEPRWRANFETNLAALLGHPRAADFAFMTPPAFVAWHRAQATRDGQCAVSGGGPATGPV